MSDNTVSLNTSTSSIQFRFSPAASLDPASFPATPGPGSIHPTSRLIPVLLDDGSPLGLDAPISSRTLAARLRAEHGVTKLDVVLANAGGSTAMGGVLDTDPEEMVRDFGVNAVGEVRLLQAVWPLLKRAEGEEGLGKFVYVSSTLGSIGLLDRESMPGVAYGMSKAAANWFAKKVSVELKGQVVVGVLHPGWVQTALGQSLADAVGFKEPPTTAEQSAKGVVEQIDNWTPEKSGQFLSYHGNPLPW
ncbi:hypothetical protein CHGG_04243 [Chaetomium globosum CBS 148.51]|uniref:Aflatoxin biosynthesis ketoreductase nor-1 n=1 Tax=Chaetomium globosum (strain ATCC 6205 / CBS 148.51 / DSM 1962 / NBRC 6347 / NRRL 1970) TaxID=306901 RepID=Q2H1V3_CHAGB|nr:uncharacterized protein CHGG_04243 [Chaetomium globosum CBS 148.51]EAQ87624.1 hypothetical protein CHGG_04243 [Chaetomium globosum CBS 148.51]